MLAIFAPFLLFLAMLPSWAGEWAYGPRYLLFLLPVLSLPFLSFADAVAETMHTWRARAWVLAALACLGYSAYLQVQVNRLPFFMYYYARSSASPGLVAYFFERHVGSISDDLVRSRGDLARLPYFDELKREAPPQFLRDYVPVISGMIVRGNLYWTLPPEARRSLQFPAP
jgi:hypothetical protein